MKNALVLPLWWEKRGELGGAKAPLEQAQHPLPLVCIKVENILHLLNQFWKSYCSQDPLIPKVKIKIPCSVVFNTEGEGGGSEGMSKIFWTLL